MFLGLRTVIYPAGVPDATRALAQLEAAGAEAEGEVQDVGEDIRVATVRLPISRAVLGIIENPHFVLGEVPPVRQRTRPLTKGQTGIPAGLNQMTEIRPTRRADIPALKAVLDATQLFPSELLDDMLKPFLSGEQPRERWRTAETDDGPVAVAYSAPEPMTEGTSNLLLIAVLPDHQGRGIGHLLMRDAEQALAERGERILLVETSSLPGFLRTRDFYRALGYTEEARIRDYYAAGDDKIVFWKALQ